MFAAMAMVKTSILNHKQIITVLDRIALEICERHHQGYNLSVGGISERGSMLAAMLVEKVKVHHTGEVNLFRIDFDREGFDWGKIQFTPLPDFARGHVILVDDVLNSGKTLVHLLQPIVKAWPATLETVFLAERSYRSFPVKADYVGISLATTLQEHVYFNAEDPNNLQLYLA